jgi:type II secretory pathway predicted ATPase ExeA
MINLQNYFGLSREPFSPDLKVEQLYTLPDLRPLVDRFDYAVRNAHITVIIGDVGSGKSTSLRYAVSRLHPSEYRVFSLVATSGSLLELYRQLCMAMGVENRSYSTSYLTKTLREMFCDIVAKKQIPLLLIDEAHLLRLDVFKQLHTLAQIDYDSQALLPVVLSGQDLLIDKLVYHTSRPFASRILGRSRLQALNRSHMEGYLNHHLEVAGTKETLFVEEALTAIHQGSGGLLRRANHLAKGALLAAAAEDCRIVSAEHVRIASTEIF